MFAAPWFLAGLLAIGLPLWLHRIARTERIKLPFASLMLLEASEVRDTSRRTLRYWLLLLVRIALVLALALAFAQPFLKSRSAADVNQAHLHAIVIDASLSMQQGQRWQLALDRARLLIDGVKSSDRAMLVAASGRKIELLAGPVFGSEASVLRAALADLKPSLQRLDYGLLMSGSKAWISAEGLPSHLHLITDLQQSASPLRFADLEPPPNTSIEIHDVSAAGAANASIARLSVGGATDRTVTATIRGTDAATPARDVILTIDDREVARKRVTLGDERGVDAVFPGIRLSAGSHRLHVSIEPRDALALDDDHYAVIEHTEPTVLLVTNDSSGDDAAYLAAAIESQSALHLTVQHTTPLTFAKTLATKPLAEFSAVVVADSGILSAADARKLTDFVQAGGAALVTLGAKAAQLSAEPITGMAIRKTSDAEQRVAVVDDSHPVLRDASGWRAVRFMKHIEVRPAAPETSESARQDRTLIELEDHSPLLLERTGEAGRLLVLTAPLDRAWNDLAIHPLFVRFIAETARYLTDRDAAATSYAVGAQVVTGLTAGAGGQIFDPEGRRVLGLQDAAQASRFSPELTGIYEVRSSNQKRWFAVNPDVRESDLTPMTADNVKRWQALRFDAPQAAAVPASASGKSVPGDARTLGFAILMLLAALVVAELLLANYRLSIRRDGSIAAPSMTASEAT